MHPSFSEIDPGSPQRGPDDLQSYRRRQSCQSLLHNGSNKKRLSAVRTAFLFVIDDLSATAAVAALSEPFYPH